MAWYDGFDFDANICGSCGRSLGNHFERGSDDHTGMECTTRRGGTHWVDPLGGMILAATPAAVPNPHWWKKAGITHQDLCGTCGNRFGSHRGMSTSAQSTNCPASSGPNRWVTTHWTPSKVAVPTASMGKNTKAPPAPKPVGGWCQASRKQKDVCAECGEDWALHNLNACSGAGGRKWADPVGTSYVEGVPLVPFEPKFKTVVKDDRWPHKCYGCGGDAYIGMRCHCKRSCKPEYGAT